MSLKYFHRNKKEDIVDRVWSCDVILMSKSSAVIDSRYRQIFSRGLSTNL